MSNHFLIGTADKTPRLLELAARSFLVIDDGPIADAFLEHFPRARLFDVTQHSFNPLTHIDYKRARDFAAALYTASPEGKDTLTVRNGKRAMVRLLLASTRLDRIDHSSTDPGMAEAVATIDDLLISPVLQQVLCTPTNFPFKGQIVAKLDRAQLGDFDAFILASLLIGHVSQGHTIIVPDLNFYGRDFHIPLIRQQRLVAGIYVLDALPANLRQNVLMVKDKTPAQCTWEDALVLARYAGLIPGTVGHTEFLENAIA